MFTDNHKCKFNNGYICVQAAKAEYSPGEMVTGNIYLKITHAFGARHIELQVRG